MSDTSQGEGWWVASDGKWYAPEQHPDYSGPAVSPTPANLPIIDTSSRADNTIVVPEPGAIPTGDLPDAVLQSTTPGPSFAPPGDVTTAYVPPDSSSGDPDFNLTKPDEPSGNRRNLILGLAGILLIGGLGFLAFRFLGGGSSGGADSPETAVQQLIDSINEKDAVGFVDVFDPDEIEGWFGSYGPALAQFDQTEDGETSNELTDVYDSVFDAFNYTLTGPNGDAVTYDVEMLDDDGRISQVRVEGLDFTLTTGDANSALIGAFDDDPVAIDVSEFDNVSIEVRDERGGLALTLLRPGFPREEEFAEGGHIDLVTVQKDGKWFISIGYSVLELFRNSDEFPNTRPDYGRAFRLIDEQTGGAETPDGAVQELFTATEALDYDAVIQLVDPLGTPYLHDYQPLIDAEIDDRERREAAADGDLRFDDLDLVVEEWEGRTLVTFDRVSGSAADGVRFDLDTATWCLDFEDDFENEVICAEDGIEELLLEADSRESARDFIPARTGMIVVERNGRWYLDPLATMGYYADQLAEPLNNITEELQASASDDLASFLIVEGPIARQGTPGIATAESGQVGVAMNLDAYPTVGDDFNDWHVAVARIVASETGSYYTDETLRLDDETWAVVYQTAETDNIEIPAIAALTDGELDIELFEVQVNELGVDGLTGQFGGQGRPHIVTLSDAARDIDFELEGAQARGINSWENNGVALPGSFRFSGTYDRGAFVVLQGEPGATYAITPIGQDQPEPVPPPTPPPPPPTTPAPIEGSGSSFADPTVDEFAALVGITGYDFVSEQGGGFFDGCNGPDDSDVSSYLFETSGGALVVLTPYPTEDRAAAAFNALVDVSSPCTAFASVVVNDIVVVDDSNIRIEWELETDDDSTTFEQYRLVGDTIIVSVAPTVAGNDEQFAFLDAWDG